MTANPASFVVDGSSVVPGGAAVTLAGSSVSLDRGGNLLLGTATISLGAITTYGGVAGAIMSAFGRGEFGTSASVTASSMGKGDSNSTGVTSGAVVFQGGSGRREIWGWVRILSVMGLCLVMRIWMS